MSVNQFLEKILPAVDGGQVSLRCCKRIDRRGFDKVETRWWQVQFSRGMRDYLFTADTLDETIEKAVAATEVAKRGSTARK